MEFFVTCLIDISDFVLIGISFVSILMTSYKVIMWVKGHQVKFQYHHLSVITNLCLHFIGQNVLGLLKSSSQF